MGNQGCVEKAMFHFLSINDKFCHKCCPVTGQFHLYLHSITAAPSPYLLFPLLFTAKLARLSLTLPPLALTLPPTGKGFNNGPIGSRLSRRRDLSSGADSDEDEDELEDEGTRRVIVVTETDVDKRVGLRSLLKSPKEPMDREKDRGRNVSFFDDVTIYLFDQVFLKHVSFLSVLFQIYRLRLDCATSLQQETPTNELSMSASTSPTPVSVKSSKLDLHGK